MLKVSEFDDLESLKKSYGKAVKDSTMSFGRAKMPKMGVLTNCYKLVRKVLKKKENEKYKDNAEDNNNDEVKKEI